MPDIYDVAEAQRKALAAREAAAAARMISAYDSVFAVLHRRALALATEISSAEAAGNPVSVAKLARMERYQDLLRQTSTEMSRFAGPAASLTTAEQKRTISTAETYVKRMVDAAMGPPPIGLASAFNQLPTSAVENVIGFTADGSPLRALFDQLGPDASAHLRSVLVNGVATGVNPRVLAADVNSALLLPRTRALTIMRTETMRAHREATTETFKSNQPVVQGWFWWAELGRRTCPACWAMHGSRHRVDEIMGSHPCCRCTMLPITQSWEDLGYKVNAGRDVPPPQKGADAFAALSATDQRFILGPGKFKAYQAGEIELRDVVQTRRSAVWGLGRGEASLQDALAKATSRAKPVLTRDALSESMFGGSTPNDAALGSALNQQRLAAFGQQYFGRTLTTSEWYDLAGAPRDVPLTIDVSGDTVRLRKRGRHEFIDNLARDVHGSRGGVYIHNVNLFLDDSAPAGYGTRMLAKEIETARPLGINKITTQAFGKAGTGEGNGYYTWPRLGYDGKIPDEPRAALDLWLAGRKIDPASVTKVSDLMKIDDGASWWKQHGSTFDAEFALPPSSLSSRVFSAYTAAKGIKV